MKSSRVASETDMHAHHLGSGGIGASGSRTEEGVTVLVLWRDGDLGGRGLHTEP